MQWYQIKVIKFVDIKANPIHCGENRFTSTVHHDQSSFELFCCVMMSHSLLFPTNAGNCAPLFSHEELNSLHEIVHHLCLAKKE